MFKGLSNLESLMRQAREISSRMEQFQEELREKRVEGTAGGGMVVVEANANQEVVGCRIDPALVARGDQEMLEDLVVVAVNEALTRAREVAKDEAGKLAGSFNVPGIGELMDKITGRQPDEQEADEQGTTEQ